ncbi:hypothetical protein D9756_003252 [Leucocoprinus leucothites]|uniref:Uncharacterized protein n=1 Tax=Leucocoprinus leucothites TaxID=201217 RepID=A0A8H5G711_9AGAR|nr:hypothetical protein D9756_003252 [Leucoagaricus leucothites]
MYKIKQHCSMESFRHLRPQRLLWPLSTSVESSRTPLSPPLAMLFRHLCLKWGRIYHLEASIPFAVIALSLTPGGHPRLAHFQQRLAVSLRERYQRQGKVWDLHLVISLQKSALIVVSPKDSDLGWHQQNPAVSCECPWSRFGQLEDLKTSLDFQLRTFSTLANDDPGKEWWMTILALTYCKFYDATGNPDHLESASPEGLKATTGGTTEYHMVTMSPALSYGDPYELTKNPQDLDTSLGLTAKAMSNLPRDDRYYPQSSYTASQQSLHKYRRDYDTTDLEEAPPRCQIAIETTRRNKSSLGLYKGHMVRVYLDFYRRFGSMSDLKLGIDLCLSAITLLPPGHVKLAFQQTNLSNLCVHLYRRHHDTQHLESALRWGALALENVTKTSSLFTDCLHRLSIIYQFKVKVTRDPRESDHALTLMQRVLDATPQNSPDLPGCYNSMVSLYSTRYMGFGGPETRDTTLTYMRAAVEAAKNAQEDHFGGAHHYTVLAGIYTEKFALDQDEEIKKLILNTYRHASHFTTSNPDYQWDLAQKWAPFADSVHTPEALDVYRHAFIIALALLWFGANITTRHEALVKYNVAKMASNAIVSCIWQENYEAAVEFLERSLSVTFNQLLDLQTDLFLLEAHHPGDPDLANNLRQISDELRQLATTTIQSDEEKLDKALSHNSDKMRKLALEGDTLLQQVRTITDFEYFLLPLLFWKLREAAVDGPVVIITSTDMRCDVLIFLSAKPSPFHLCLLRVKAKVPQAQHQHLQKALEELGIHTRNLQEADRGGRVTRWRKGT